MPERKMITFDGSALGASYKVHTHGCCAMRYHSLVKLCLLLFDSKFHATT